MSQIWKFQQEEKEGTGLRHPIPGCRVILHTNGHSSIVRTDGHGIYLSPPRHPISRGNGVYLDTGTSLYKGGLLNGPLAKVPILRYLTNSL